MGTGRYVRVVTNPNARIRAIRHVQNEFYRQETSKGLRKEQQAGQVKRMAPFFNKKKREENDMVRAFGCSHAQTKQQQHLPFFPLG